MPSISFGTSSYERARGGLPSLPVINMVVEEAPTEEQGVVLQSRPGLADRNRPMGDGPIAALFRKNGVFSEDLFGISGNVLYRETDAIGLIDGAGVAKMAGYEDTLFMTRGKGLWAYDGTALTQITFPDSADVASVVVGASRLVVLRRDTQKFYWTEPLAGTIDALNFASAEDSPDELLDILWVDDFLVLFGAETVEPWARSTDPDLPFTRLQGATITKGIRNTGACCTFNSAFAWVTNEHAVCVQNESNVISNTGLQVRIQAAAVVSLFTLLLDGDEYLVLRMDDETQVFSPRSKRWSEFTSQGHTNWVANTFAKGTFGSAIDGRTFEWSKGHEDLGGVLERKWRGGYPINSGGMQIINAMVRCNVGQTTYLEGAYADPAIEMRQSRDAGQTWGSWRASSLGRQGRYRNKVQWRACGMASQPAFFAEFRVTAPVDFRVSDVRINEPWGGR